MIDYSKSLGTRVNEGVERIARQLIAAKRLSAAASAFEVFERSIYQADVRDMGDLLALERRHDELSAELYAANRAFMEATADDGGK